MKSSKTGVLGGTQACLCKDGTYSVDCCDGSIYAQRFNFGAKEVVPEGANKYLVKKCIDDHTHHVHIHDATLTIGAVYFMNYANDHHNGCYSVVEEVEGGGLHLESVDLYADCATCLAST